MDFSEILEKLGEFGKYQRIIFSLISLIQFQTAFNIMGIVFIAGVPNHWCKTPGLLTLNLTDEKIKNITLPLVEKNGELVYSSCQRYVYENDNATWNMDDVTRALSMDKANLSTAECSNGWHYDDDVYTSTIVSQWDLVCGRSWLQAMVSSVYMSGFMVGVILSGSISDIFGRRPVLIVALLGTLVSSVSVSFAPNYLVFMCLRFFSAFFIIALFTTAFVIAIELTGPVFRPHAGTIPLYIWCVGYLLIALMAYFMRDWYTLNLVSSCSCIALVVILFFIPESILWLYANNKADKAEKIIREAAKTNKVELPDKLDITFKSTKKGYIWDLFRTPRMACRSVNVCFNWFVVCGVYYGLSLNTSNLGGNDYVNFAISGGVEIPATMLTQLVLHYGGRRWPLASSMILGGASLIAPLAVPQNLNWVSITLAMIGKFGITIAFSIIYIFTAEMYPTTVRNVAVASGSLCARIGAIIAPFIAKLSDINRAIPLVIFGVLSLAAGLLALLLPETKGTTLPETMEDVEKLGRKEKKMTGDDNKAFEENTEEDIEIHL